MEIPQYTDETYEDILTWAGAVIEWDEGVLVNSEGEESIDPRFAGWTLTHKWGCWQLGRDSIKSRMHAALFLFLWHKGVGLPLSDELASFYVEHR